MKKGTLNRLLHRAGSLLALLGLAYLFHTIWQKVDSFEQLSIPVVMLTLLLAMVYGSGNALLARAWWHILRHLNLRPTQRWSLKAYGSYQITKYVPGNVANLLGRQSLGMAAGLPAWPLARSTLWELGLIASSAALYAVLLTPQLWPYAPLSVAAAAFVLVSIGLSLALLRLGSADLAAAQALQAFFLLLSSGCFVALLHFLDPAAIASLERFLLVVAAFNIAWLVGLVTPGAPAGIGVREALIVGSLGSFMTHETLLLAVLLSRLVSVFGDLMFWLATSLVRQQHAEAEKTPAC